MQMDEKDQQTTATSLRSYFNKKSEDTVTCRLCKRDVKAAKGQYIL